MRSFLLTGALLLTSLLINAQQLLLLDRFNGNAVVNDSTLTVFSSEADIHDITQYFTMKNNTDKKLAVFLRKTINSIVDSTTDYYCFGIRCWPGDDSTNIADTIPPWGEDFTFASHVTHQRRFDLPQPILPLGYSSITYTVYDKTTFPEPVEASVTVIYHHSGMGIGEEETGGQGEEETGGQGDTGKGRRGDMDLDVFPNPVSGSLTVVTCEQEPGNYTLLICNSLGIQVSEKNVHLQENNLTLPVNGFRPGLYFGRLVSGQGKIYIFKFQVSH
jgi:hypothetical protein